MHFQHLTALVAVPQLRGREMFFLADISRSCPVPDTQRAGSHLEEQLQDSSDLAAALHPALAPVPDPPGGSTHLSCCLCSSVEFSASFQ